MISVCRVCLCDRLNLHNLFENNLESRFFKMIIKYLDIQLIYNDPVSNGICEDCSQILLDFDTFYKYVQEKQAHYDNLILNNLNGVHHTRGDESQENQTIKGTTVAEPEIEINYPCVQDESNDPIIQNNDLEFFDQLNESEIESITFKSKRARNLDIKRESSNKKHSNAEICNKYATKKQQTDENIKKKGVELKATEQELLILSYMQLKCDLCPEEFFEKFDDMKSHFRTEHKIRGYVSCCNTRFKTRKTLSEHVRWHLEPDLFKCKICSKKLKSKNCRDIHMKVVHTSEEERTHQCPICNKKFAFAFLLKNHQSAHKKEKPEICPVCKKSFKLPNLLKRHIRKVHEEIDMFVCDTCGREYKSKQCFDRHCAEHRGIIQQATKQCDQCGKWFKPQNLKKHAQMHNRQDFRCTVCSRSCPTDAALKAHVRYVHTDAKFNCTYCGKAFKKEERLKEHIGTHTGAKDHSCPHCSREFRSKANMYVHIKREHFDHWKLTQTNRHKLSMSKH